MTLILLYGVNKGEIKVFNIISTFIRIFTAWNLAEWRTGVVKGVWGKLRSVHPENSCVSSSNRIAAYK